MERITHVPALPSAIALTGRVCNFRTGQLSLRGKTTLSVSRAQLRSAIQKAVRRQDFRLAKQSATLYLWLAGSDVATQTWLLNRLPIIAIEDCAHDRVGCWHALLMWGDYNRGLDIPFNRILDVLHYLTANGTSRKFSWQRATSTAARPEHLLAVIQKGLLAGDINVTHYVAVVEKGEVRKLYAQFTSLLQRYTHGFGRRFLTHFLRFIEIKYAVGITPFSDMDLMLRAWMMHFIDLKVHPSIATPDTLLAIEHSEPTESILTALPAFVNDMHVTGKSEAGRVTFALDGARIIHPVLHDPRELEWARLYYLHKGVSDVDTSVALTQLQADADAYRESQLSKPTRRRISDEDEEQPKRAKLLPRPTLPESMPQQPIKDGRCFTLDDLRIRPHHEQQSLGMKGGLKAPTFITNDDCFVKIFDDLRAADYAARCINMLSDLDVLPGTASVIEATLDESLLLSLGNTRQALSWRKRFKPGKTWALITGAIGNLALPLMKIDHVSNDMIVQFTGLCVFRWMVGTTDNVLANFGTYGDLMHTFDFNYAERHTTFADSLRNFTHSLQSRVHAAVYANKVGLDRLVADIKATNMWFVHHEAEL